MKLIRAAAAIAFALLVILSLNAPAQLARVTLTPARIFAGDTTDHIDLALNRSPSLASASVILRAYDAAGVRLSSYSATWVSDNPGIATAAAGVVRARGDGQTTITARVTAGGRTIAATIVACVTDSLGLGVVVHNPPYLTRDSLGVEPDHPSAAAGERVSYTATRTNGDPINPACLHWWVLEPSLARVNRRGVVTALNTFGAPRTVHIKARLGSP